MKRRQREYPASLGIGMGRSKRKQVLMALGIVMLIGFVFQGRLWAVDYVNSSNDIELLRKEFDLANREAMDESADWRRRYDSEFEKASTCLKKLEELNKSGGEAEAVSTTHEEKMQMLEKENMQLLEKMESLKRELEEEKRKCSTHNI